MEGWVDGRVGGWKKNSNSRIALAREGVCFSRRRGHRLGTTAPLNEPNTQPAHSPPEMDILFTKRQSRSEVSRE